MQIIIKTNICFPFRYLHQKDSSTNCLIHNENLHVISKKYICFSLDIQNLNSNVTLYLIKYT